VRPAMLTLVSTGNTPVLKDIPSLYQELQPLSSTSSLRYPVRIASEQALVYLAPMFLLMVTRD
jgi:hypothetical protein